MKTRLGFVSNSSSSSFVINKNFLTEKQIEQIWNHFIILCGTDCFYEADYFSDYDEWNITEDEDEIKGTTMMDNLDMKFFLDWIGVPNKYIKWSD